MDIIHYGLYWHEWQPSRLNVGLIGGAQSWLQNFLPCIFSSLTSKIRGFWLKLVKMETGRGESFRDAPMQLLWWFESKFAPQHGHRWFLLKKNEEINTDIYLSDILKNYYLLPWAQEQFENLTRTYKPDGSPAHISKKLRSGSRGIFPISLLLLNGWHTRQVWMLWTTAFGLFWRKKNLRSNAHYD